MRTLGETIYLDAVQTGFRLEFTTEAALVTLGGSGTMSIFVLLNVSTVFNFTMAYFYNSSMSWGLGKLFCRSIVAFSGTIPIQC